MSAALKAKGNAHFAKKEWNQAIEFYTKAIEAETDTSAKAPLYSNRSAALVHEDRLEEGEFFVRSTSLCSTRTDGHSSRQLSPMLKLV